MTSVVAGSVSLAVQPTTPGTRRPRLDCICFLRDVGFFLCSLAVLSFIIYEGKIRFLGAVGYLSLYVLYGITVATYELVKQRNRKKRLSHLEPLLSSKLTALWLTRSCQAVKVLRSKCCLSLVCCSVFETSLSLLLNEIWFVLAILIKYKIVSLSDEGMEDGLEPSSDIAEESASSVGDLPPRWDWQATHHVAIYSQTSLAALEATMAEVNHGGDLHGDYTLPLNEALPMEVRSLKCA